MELSDYTTEELRAELSRRYAVQKEARQNESRCRNCVHCRPNPTFPQFFQCVARIWGKTYVRNYCVKPYQKACNLYERKVEESGYSKQISEEQQKIEELIREKFRISIESTIASIPKL